MIKLNFEDYNVEREKIQIVVLDILSRINYMKNATLQGGGALRLCYKSTRFSVDLDFVAEKFETEKLGEIQDTLKKELQRHFQNKIEVVVKKHREYSILDSIFVRVYQEDKNKKRIEICIEIAEGIPALTSEMNVASSKHFPNLFVFINTEKIEEILADKVVAFGGRKVLETMPFKARDVWDLFWITGIKTHINKEMILKKIKNYHIDKELFISNFKQRLQKLKTPDALKHFQAEMLRFADQDMKNIIENNSAAMNILEQVYSFMSDFLKEILENLY